MMGRSPKYYIPNFVEIGQLVPKKIFEGFLPYMGAVNKLSFHIAKEVSHQIWL